MRINEIQRKLILMQMVMDGFKGSTIEFARDAYPHLSQPGGSNLGDIANEIGMCERNVRRHLRQLVENGYAVKLNHYQFALNRFSEIVSDSDLRMFSELSGASV